MPVICAYVFFAILGLTVFHTVAEGEFSSILTMSVMVQCLGVALLCIQVKSTGSASGISARSLMLDAFAFGFRLSSTTWLDGYLPSDPSGDHVYQIIDGCSLIMVFWLLHRMLVVQRDTYDASADSFCVGPMVLSSLALAALLHGDMNANPLFDTFWLTSVFIGVVAVLPQLSLTMQTGGRVEALTSHYIAALALSRVLSGYFMWEAKHDITCEPWVTGFSHTVVAILGAHLVHLLLLCDFAYYYARAVVRKGLSGPVELGGVDYV